MEEGENGDFFVLRQKGSGKKRKKSFLESRKWLEKAVLALELDATVGMRICMRIRMSPLPYDLKIFVSLKEALSVGR